MASKSLLRDRSFIWVVAGVVVPSVVGVWSALAGSPAVSMSESEAAPVETARHIDAPGTLASEQQVCDAARLERGGSTGPDVIVGDLPGVSYYGTLDGIAAYAVGTTSCNIGDEVLQWDADTNNHPVIGQNMYRYQDGRMTQIGQSWLKHGFLALAQSLCDTCQNPNNGQLLGVGCSDPYSSGLNGSQNGLGPRFEVNPATGAYPYPATDEFQTGNAIYKRIQVRASEVDPSREENSDALYFVEGQYVTPDDAAAGNNNNNASYREVSINSSLQALTLGSTQRELPAIFAWQAIDPAVEILTLDIPGDGRVHVAYRVTDNLDGTWRYEYAIHNLNSNRAISSVRIPRSAKSTITGQGFHDVDYHSGEPWDPTDWSMHSLSPPDVAWATSPLLRDGFESGDTSAWGGPGDVDHANAIRWGTTYNFWFTADTAPVQSVMELGLFLPGLPAAVNTRVMGPG